jgi:hypothetical protein
VALRHGTPAVWLVLVLAGCGSQSPPRAPAPAGPRLTAKVAHALTAALREKVRETGVPGASATVIFADGRT